MKTWSYPLGYFGQFPLLSSTTQQVDKIKVAQEIRLFSQDKTLCGILQLQEKYESDKDLECKTVFDTTKPYPSWSQTNYRAR